MKRHTLVLFLAATFLMNGSWLSSLEAKPAKSFKGAGKKFSGTAKKFTKFKAPAKKVKPWKPAVVKPAIVKPPVLKPAIVKPSMVFPPIVTTPILPPPILKPRPLRPSVRISVGVIRPVRIYSGRSIVTRRVSNPQPMRIVEVLDTIHVLVAQGKSTFKVRLVGLDPATSGEVYPEVHGAAVSYMKREFEGKIVYLNYDAAVGSADEQGTKLAYVYRSEDRQLVNEAVIENGFALATQSYDYEQKAEFQSDQALAEKANSGVWSKVPVQGG